MNRRTAFNYIVAATLVVGLGANSAMASSYPPITNPDAPHTKIPKDFKGNGPKKTFLTHFDHTFLPLKEKQIVRPAVAGFITGHKVKVKIKLPSGAYEVYSLITVGPKGILFGPAVYFVRPGKYIMSLQEAGIPVKTITFDVKG